MTFITDAHGKVHITAPCGNGDSISFAITGRDGDQFTPGMIVEYSDAAMQSLLQQLLAPFQSGSIAIKAAP